MEKWGEKIRSYRARRDSMGLQQGRSKAGGLVEKTVSGGGFVYGAVRVGGRNDALGGMTKRRGSASGTQEITSG